MSKYPKVRKSWKVDPATKVKESKKLYNRKKEKIVLDELLGEELVHEMTDELWPD